MPNQRRIYSLQHGRFFFRPNKCAKLGLNSSSPILKGLGGSNPPLSATESTISTFYPEKWKILRTFAKFVRFKGTGESQFRPAAADSCSIISVESQPGALFRRSARFSVQ